MPAQNSLQTIVCSVMYIDIIGYSIKTVVGQLKAKEQFSRMLAHALADVPPASCMVLDTGDGAAVSFLGDPEDAMFAALRLRDEIAMRDDESLRFRIGINLGPVRLAKDVNGLPSIVGDGINVAQRIMAFAGINQVFVSRSYFEIISVVSDEYARLLTPQGSRNDKHDRVHEVYLLGNMPAPHRPKRQPAHPALTHAASLFKWLDAATARLRFRMRLNPLVVGAGGIVFLLLLAGVIRLIVPANDSTRQVAHVSTPSTPQGQTAPAAGGKPTPGAAAIDPQKYWQRSTAEFAQSGMDVKPGMLRMDILPWGEILVDDVKFGVSPPLRTIALKPGNYKIEIRNTGFASFLQLVEVRSGAEFVVRHRFE